MQGNVIGINNAIFSPSGGSVGIGFAIPAEIAAPIVEKLKSGKEIERGYLGVSIQPVNEDFADVARPAQAIAASSSRRCSRRSRRPRPGIEPGDIVTKVDGKEVTPTRRCPSSSPISSRARASRSNCYREGKRRTVNVTVGQRPTEEELAQRTRPSIPMRKTPMPEGQSSGMIEESLGLQVMPLTPQIARQLGLPGTIRRACRGRAVDPNSDAGAQGPAARGHHPVRQLQVGRPAPADLERLAQGSQG